MPTGGKLTLTQFLIEERRRAPGATGELNALVTDISLACKAISRRVAYGRLDPLGAAGLAGARTDADDHGDGAPVEPEDWRTRCRDVFLRANEWGGHVAGMLCPGAAQPFHPPERFARGKYLLCFDALDGAADGAANATVGSLFSILRAPRPGEAAGAEDFLQPGSSQVGAGYAIYGPSTLLVLSLGHGTHAFTLDPLLGEWVLSHPHLHIPERSCEFAIDAANTRFWDPAVKRYVDECLAGQSGPRGMDGKMRWIAALVAEAHRILLRGGVFLLPDSGSARGAGGVHRLCAAHPIAFLVEQAGGCASDGQGRVLEHTPQALHEGTGLMFGSPGEVALIERYHQSEPAFRYDAPLFRQRGLFASHAA